MAKTKDQTQEKEPELAEYPWDQCVRDQTERYGSQETAKKVCAMIKRKYGHGSMMLPANLSLDALYPEIEETLDIKPVKTADMVSDFLFVDMQATNLVDGKPFDGLAPSDPKRPFVDMHGTIVHIKSDRLQTYVKNTLALIANTKTESGEVVGLPIDSKNHEKGEAAGWIVNVELAGDVVKFFPKWTHDGQALITGGKFRYFSPTLDLDNEVILGGSLTNWPASRDAKSRPLLQPVELSSGLFTNDPIKNPLEDRQEDEPMTIKLADFTPEDRAALVAEVAKVVTPAPTAAETPKTPGIENLLDLAGLSEEAKNARIAEMQSYLANVRKQAELEFQAQMARLQHESRVTELCQKLTGGTNEAPRGIPVQLSELREHLLKLEAPEAKWWGELLASIQGGSKSGLIEFAERGHNGTPKGTAQLPSEYAAALDTGTMKVSDLTSPVLGLGDLSQYDLSKWQAGGAK